MRPRERRPDRREQRDAHPEAEPRRGVEEEQRQILGPAHHREAPDPGNGHERAEHEDPAAADPIREPAAEEIARHHAQAAEGEEPHHRRGLEPPIHRVGHLVGRHDLETDHAERHHDERGPEPAASQGSARVHVSSGALGRSANRGAAAPAGPEPAARADRGRAAQAPRSSRRRCRRRRPARHASPGWR